MKLCGHGNVVNSVQMDDWKVVSGRWGRVGGESGWGRVGGGSGGGEWVGGVVGGVVGESGWGSAMWVGGRLEAGVCVHVLFGIVEGPGGHI